VDQRVGGGEQRRHLGREAEQEHLRDVPEAHREPAPQRLVAPAHHDDPRDVERQRGRDRAFDVADAPAAAGDDDDLPVGRQPRRPAALLARGRRREARVVHAPRRDDARARAGDRAHLLRRLGMRDQVDVHTGMRPVAQGGEVRDRGDDRHVEAAAQPQPAEHLGRAGIGRDDHVRSVLGDQPHQPAPGQQLAEAADDAAHGCHVRDERVLGVVDPIPEVGLEVRAAEHESLDERPARAQRVLDRRDDVGPARLQILDQEARGQIVPLADRRAHDEHARGRGSGCGGHGHRGRLIRDRRMFRRRG